MRLSDYLTDCDLLIAGPAALGTRELADLFQASAADAEAEERRILSVLVTDHEDSAREMRPKMCGRS